MVLSIQAHEEEKTKAVVYKKQTSLQKLQLQTSVLEAKNSELQSEVETQKLLIKRLQGGDKKRCDIAIQTNMVCMYNY